MLLATRDPFEADTLGYSYSEHLLVWTWRRLATGRGGCALIEREFDEACGEDGREVLSTYVTFLRVLGHASRRRLRIGPPGCLMVSADERRVLSLIAAAQGDEAALFDAHLDWLARSEARHALAIGARALATGLAVHGLYLTAPVSDAPDRCERQPSVQVCRS